MRSKLTILKRCLALAGGVLLVKAVWQESKLPAATGESHITTPVLTYEKMDWPQTATNSGFQDKTYLSLVQPVIIPDPDLYRASLNFQSDFPDESFDHLSPRPDGATKSRLKVADRKLNYDLIDSGDFALKLNLKPAYASPEALIPTSLDPGLGISLKF